MAISENKRTDSIRVRLSPEMMERFEKLAERFGMPPATLCAFAVATFVQKEENNVKFAQMAVIDSVRRQGDNLSQLFTDEKMERIFSPLFTAMFEGMKPSLQEVKDTISGKSSDSEDDSRAGV
jgi:predicted DNA-binding protein